MNKLQELTAHKNEVDFLQNKHSKEINILKDQISKLDAENKRLRELVDKQEIGIKESQRIMQEFKKVEAEAQEARRLAQEVDRLGGVLADKEKNIGDLKSQAEDNKREHERKLNKTLE